MAEEIIDIVDEKDNIIGQEGRDVCHKKGLRHRIVGIFLFNAAGKLWLQTRSAKKASGKKLDFSASGHVGQGDAYDNAALRELREELGVTATLSFLGKIYYEKNKGDHHSRHFLAIYEGKHNGPFLLQEEEVEKIEAYDLGAVKKLVEEDSQRITFGLKTGVKYFVNQNSKVNRESPKQENGEKTRRGQKDFYRSDILPEER